LTQLQSENPHEIEINFSNVQGNILRGFNKDHVRFIFFNIEDVKKARDWFSQLVEQKRIPSTADLIESAKKMKERWEYEPNFKPRETWIHVAFTSFGIIKFGLELPPSHKAYGFKHLPEGGPTDPNEPTDKEDPEIFLEDAAAVVDNDDPFNAGMKNRSGLLGDTDKDDPANWIEPFNKKYDLIEGVIRIDADETEDVNKTTVELISESTARGITSLGLQIGDAVLNRHGKHIEHFGFRDGVSQPLFEGIDDDEIAKRKIEVDIHDPKKFVLFGLEGNREWANDGSFMVIRRLSQDFAGFWEFMSTNGSKFGLTPTGLAARFVGRWPSGAPLAKFQNGDPLLPKEFDDNDFKFFENKEESGTAHLELDDKEGNHTPRFAHIRKVYPRDDGLSDNAEVNDKFADIHRIIRRGIAFGPLFEDIPDAERGLVFVCHQIDLEQQFEFIQKKLANDPKFPKTDPRAPNGHGVDAIIGKHHDTGFDNLLQDGNFKKISGFKQWITTTGGQYFFSPSISALKSL
jgi:Dyp-type peroxidase family